jgi:hypothetical protein
MTIRFPYDYSSILIREELQKQFFILRRLFISNESFFVSITGNAIMKSIHDTAAPSYSIFYGQDFSPIQSGESSSINDLALAPSFEVNTIQDVNKLPVIFTTEDFQNVFNVTRSSSKFRVFRMLNLIYIFRKFHDDNDLKTDNFTHNILS